MLVVLAAVVMGEGGGRDNVPIGAGIGDLWARKTFFSGPRARFLFRFLMTFALRLFTALSYEVSKENKNKLGKKGEPFRRIFWVRFPFLSWYDYLL